MYFSHSYQQNDVKEFDAFALYNRGDGNHIDLLTPMLSNTNENNGAVYSQVFGQKCKKTLEKSSKDNNLRT